MPKYFINKDVVCTPQNICQHLQIKHISIAQISLKL